MKNIIVLGAGMIGSAIARDLSKDHNTTVADVNQDTLSKVAEKSSALNIMQLDVTKHNHLKEAIKSFDLVVCAVPGFLGYDTLKAIIEAGKDVVDISFFAEDALELDYLAKENDVTAIVDCGVAPGMDNIILGYYNTQMKVTDFECLVGGLPKEKKWPFKYKAPFSPIDVIEEYTRPARYVENGEIIVKEALTDVEDVDFESCGTLESFNSDGLRSLITTMSHIPNMKEKTLRYPGHVEYINVLKQSGFFSEDTLVVNRVAIQPREFTSRVLFKDWYLGENDEEFTIMRVSIGGTDKTGNEKKVVYEVYDEYDEKTKTSSMARTTGYTACAAAHVFLNGMVTQKGIIPPEFVGGTEGCFDFVIGYLKNRGVHYNVKTSEPVGS